MSRFEEIFSRNLWDSTVSPNSITYSKDNDICVVLGETLQVYIPAYARLTNAIFRSRWMKIATSKQSNDSKASKVPTVSSSSHISSTNPTYYGSGDLKCLDDSVHTFSWKLRSLDIANATINFKSASWTPGGVGYPSRHLLTILLDEGTLLLAHINAKISENISFYSMIGNICTISVNGIDIVANLSAAFPTYRKIIIGHSWVPTLFSTSEGCGQTMIMITISADGNIAIWRLCSFSSDYLQSSSPAAFFSPQFGVGSLSLIESVNIQYQNPGEAALATMQIAISCDKFVFDEENKDKSCDLFITSTFGVIQRILLTFSTDSAREITVAYQSVWSINPFEADIEMMSPFLYVPQISPICLISSGYNFGVLDSHSGVVVTPSFRDAMHNDEVISIEHKLSGLSFIKNPYDTNNPRKVLAISSLITGTVCIWEFICPDNVMNASLTYLCRIKPCRHYITSIAIDSLHQCLLLMLSIPTDNKNTRDNQLNLGLKSTYSKIRVLPLNQLFSDCNSVLKRDAEVTNDKDQHAKLAPYDLRAIDSSAYCDALYRLEFTRILRELCLDSYIYGNMGISDNAACSSKNHAGLSLSTLPFLVFEMIKRYIVDMPPDDWGADIGLPGDINGNKSQIMDSQSMEDVALDALEMDDVMDSPIPEEEETPAKKTKQSKKSSLSKGRTSKLRDTKAERKRKHGGSGFRRMVEIVSKHPAERIYRTFDCIFASACEVAVMINAAQASMHELIFPMDMAEAYEMLFRLTTDKVHLMSKISLWRACIICFQGTFVMCKSVSLELDPKFVDICQRCKESILIAEALLTLSRAIDTATMTDSRKLLLSRVELRSLYRRCILLEQYSGQRRSGHLVALSTASSARAILGLKDDPALAQSMDSIQEKCFICDSSNISTFSLDVPLIATCMDCGVNMDRCYYTYEIIDFSSDNVVEVSVASGDHVLSDMNTFKASRQLLCCKLCNAGCINLAEEILLESIQYSFRSTEKYVSESIQTDRMSESRSLSFQWLYGIESCQRCLFCTTNLDFV